MSGCLYSLATNPDVQERLREEVRGVLGEEELVTPQHIQDMHYLRDTIKETMRYASSFTEWLKMLSLSSIGFTLLLQTTLVI